MTTYRVDVDGVTVWTDETDGYQGASHFGDYLARPADTPDGEPHPSPAYLYVDDVLIGIQRAHGDEADQCEIAAAWLYAGYLETNDESMGNDASTMKRAAADARANAWKG